VCLFQGAEIISHEAKRDAIISRKYLDEAILKPIIKQLLFLFILNLAFAFLIKGITNSFGLNGNEMAVTHSINLFSKEIDQDSWKPMGRAFDYWQESQGQLLIYTDLLIKKNIKFQYPPTALLISKILKENHISILNFSTVTTFIFMFLMIMGTAGLTFYSYKAYKLPHLSITENIAVGVLLSFLFFTFYPVVKAGTLGQIQVWLNATFAIAIFCYVTGYEVMAGILLGVMASIKPQYALFVIWGMFRGNQRLVITMILTGSLGLLMGIREFGFGTYMDYLYGLSYLANHGESFYPNQSFNGLIGRLFSVRYPDLFNNTEWRAHYFPPYNFWVATFTQITSVVILIIALIKGKGQSKESHVADFCLMGLAATMASPIAWEHHYGILFPIFVCLWLILWFGNSMLKNVWAKITFVTCYLIAANVIPFTKLLEGSYLNILQSYLFFAAFGVFILLVFIKHQPLPNARN
jgi:hypothetical protein